MSKKTYGSGSNKSTVDVPKPTDKTDTGWRKSDDKAPARGSETK